MTTNRTPFTVTGGNGQTKLWIMNQSDQLPTAFALAATNVEQKVCVRVSGGCKNMSPSDKLEMLAFFERGFGGAYVGLVWSGGSRQFTKDGELDPMVTDVPGHLAESNRCLALGSVPRTDVLRLKGESRLVLDDWGQAPNPSMSGILMVQRNPNDPADWDGDLDQAFGLMKSLVADAGFKAACVIAWNGGDITKDEIVRSAKNGWPTALVKGSGRVTDELIDGIERGDPEVLAQLNGAETVTIVDKNDPETLTSFLMDNGFLEPAAAPTLKDGKATATA